MLDAQIVKINGEVIWASEEPDILWALRGGCGGGGFAGRLRLGRGLVKTQLTKRQ
jgi:hypothetical protein